jgi:FkbM family methyltransferase
MHLSLSASTLDVEPHLYYVLDIVRHYLPTIHTIVEVGANDCVETVAFATTYPAARIFSFECNPDTLPLCTDRIAPYQNITLVPVAVGEREGTVDFYKAARVGEDWNTGASSLYQANEKYIDFKQDKITVPMSTLKKELGSRGVTTIDLIWMDLQGAELSALKGLGDTLLTNTAFIQTEVEHVPLYEGQPLFGDVRRFLHQKGFRLLTYSGGAGRQFSDVIFVNTKIYRPWIPAWLVIAYFTVRERITGKLRVLKQRYLKHETT